MLALIVRATLDKAAVWERIAPDAAPANAADAIECQDCDLLLPPHHEGHGCPRCAAPVRRRKPQSISRTIALTLAALLLYIPANIYPLATLPINFTPTKYTVLEGVIDLVQAGLWDLAILVFCASFLIPALKLAGSAGACGRCSAGRTAISSPRPRPTASSRRSAAGRWWTLS